MYEILENSTERLVVRNGQRLISIAEETDYEGNWFRVIQVRILKRKSLLNGKATEGEKFTFVEGKDRFDIYKLIKNGTLEWFKQPPSQ